MEFLKNKIYDKFIYSYLSRDSVISNLIQKGQGGAQPNISKPELENLAIIVTNNSEEQQCIGNIFENISLKNEGLIERS